MAPYFDIHGITRDQADAKCLLKFHICVQFVFRNQMHMRMISILK